MGFICFILYLYIWVFDALFGVYVFWGVIVIEAKVSQGWAPRVVERWGELDSSQCVLPSYINDRKEDPVCVVVLQIV